MPRERTWPQGGNDTGLAFNGERKGWACCRQVRRVQYQMHVPASRRLPLQQTSETEGAIPRDRCD